jgi:hypothetical protein
MTSDQGFREVKRSTGVLWLEGGKAGRGHVLRNARQATGKD